MVVLTVLGIMGGLVVLGLATFGGWFCWLIVSEPPQPPRRPQATREVRQAEADIIEINRRAQAAMLDAALQNLRLPPSKGAGR